MVVKRGKVNVRGDRLQYDETPSRSDILDVVVGLDFGTSASKVVIQAPNLPGSPAFPVDFGEDGHDAMTFLLPTKIWVDPEGRCSLTEVDGAIEVEDIKLELFATPELRSNHGPTAHKLDPEAVAAAYLALLLKSARGWLLAEKVGVFRGYSLRWQVNLGIPSPLVDMDKPENRSFARVGKAGWMLSTQNEPITLSSASNQLSRIEDEGYFDECECDFALIPEIAAGAVGYAMSDVMREGLHVMVDVGASTVDMCGFVLHTDGGMDRYSLLVADVRELGTIRLHVERIRAIAEAYPAEAARMRDEHDALQPLPDVGDFLELLVKEDEPDPIYLQETKIRSLLRNADLKVNKQLDVMLRTTASALKRQRDPNSPVWKEGGQLPILMIGGGSELQCFRGGIVGAGKWVMRSFNNDGIQFVDVRVPFALREVKEHFHRFAVAWGLSHDSFDIGLVTPVEHIEDVPAPPKRMRVEMVEN